MSIDAILAFDLLSWARSIAPIVSAVVAVISLVIAIYQFRKRKTQDDTLNGFLHGIKPTIESAGRGESISPALWQAMLTQIHDMMERLQPPRTARH
jgi:hypothetical protein